MRLFANFFKSGSQYDFKRFQKGASLFKARSPVLADFILVDPDEEEETLCTDSKYCSPFYTESLVLDIPSTLHSDTPLSMACPLGNFLDLRVTHPSLPLPMGVSNGVEICVNASFKGYLATLLMPCIWLVLGSYVCVATMAYNFHKSENKKIRTIPESSINDISVQIIQGTSACNPFIPETPLLTPEEVLESTIKQYGHLSDSDKDGDTSQSPPPSSKPKPTNPGRNTLRNTVRNDVDIMFRGTMPDSWITNAHDPRETHSASWANSAHTTAMNVTEVSTPIVRIPTRSPVMNNTSIRRSHVPKPILLHSLEVGVTIRPVTVLATPNNRPAPIITDTRYLAPMQHQCFNSSPLKYSHTMTSPRSPGLRKQRSGSLTLPGRTLKKSTRAVSS